MVEKEPQENDRFGITGFEYPESEEDLYPILAEYQKACRFLDKERGLDQEKMVEAEGIRKSYLEKLLNDYRAKRIHLVSQMLELIFNVIESIKRTLKVSDEQISEFSLLPQERINEAQQRIKILKQKVRSEDLVHKILDGILNEIVSNIKNHHHFMEKMGWLNLYNLEKRDLGEFENMLRARENQSDSDDNKFMGIGGNWPGPEDDEGEEWKHQ